MSARAPIFCGLLTENDLWVTLLIQQHAIVLLNNLNSFTSNRERADEFGDYVLEASVPWQKILFYSNLLPGMMKGENEMLVVGGVYEVRIGL